MPRIVLTEVSKSFPNRGGTVTALSDVSLTIAEGELLTVLGPSGSGKTTLLRLIAGLETPDRGRISFGAQDVTAMPPQAREVAMVFQSHALFPHFTAFQNIEFGLRLRGVDRPEREQRVCEIAELLGVTNCLQRPPAQLSGGERQRVALGRALIRKPGILLLDEPFAQLDTPLRLQLRRELPGLRQHFGATMILVTHDQREAFALGDRIAVLHDGKLEQVGTSTDLRTQPINQWVSDFVRGEA